MSEGIFSTWARSMVSEPLQFSFCLSLVWLWFLFGSVLICQGNSSAEKRQMLFRERSAEMETQSKLLTFFSQPFFETYRKWRHLKSNYYFNTAAEYFHFIRKIQLAIGK